MDIKQELTTNSGTLTVKKIANFILENPSHFDELMQCFFSNDFRLSHWASNVMNLCVEKDHHFILPYLDKIVSGLQMPTPHDAMKRNSLRVLQLFPIPEQYMGDIADLCFQYLQSAKEPIAIRVFSMTVLYNISKVYPEIKPELALIIEDMLPYGSPGIKSRGNKILKQLKRD